MTHNNPEGNWTPDDVEAHLYKAHGLPSWADPPWGQRDYFKWSELHRMGHGHAPQRGYCPACKGSGLVNDPSGRIDQMNQVEDLLKQGGKRKWDTWHGDVIKGEPLCDYCLHPEGIHDDRCTGGGGENGRCECLNGYKLNYPVDWGIKRSKTPLEEFRSLHYDVEPDDYDWEDEEQWNSLGPVDPDQYRMCPSCKGAGCENCKQSGLLGKPTEAEQPSIFKDPNRDYSLPHLKIYKKAQTWNQGNGGELDRVPPNPDVKRKPYDPYPNEGDTGEAVLPPPTGDDIKKWKTIKTFPGDKPFADHPLYQSPDDVNKGQVVGSAADDDLTTKTPAEIDAEYFPLASEHNRNLETSLKYQQYANDPKTRDYDRKRYRGYVEEYRNKADEIKAQMAPHEAEFQRRGGWNRYMLCASDGGHMHRADPICHTLTPGKSRVSMIPEASGLDDEGLVAKYGYSACTHCFKEAPTHPAWQQGEAEAQAAEKAKLDARCPASGTHYTKHNITLPEGYWQRYVRPGIRCPECGGRTVLTDTGKLRAHKPPKTSAKRVTNIDKITNYLLNYDTSQGTAHEPGADKAPNCRTCDSRHSDLTIDAAPRGDWRVDGTQGTEIDAENLAYWIPKENKHSLRYSPAAAIHTWGDSKGPGDIVHQEGFDEPSTPFSIKVLWNPYMHERDHATMNLLHEAGHYMQAKNDWDSFWDHSRGVGLHSDPDYERDAFEKGLDVARAAGVRVTSRMREQWKWSVGGEHLASKERKYAPCEFCEGSGQLPTCSMCGTNDIGTCRIGCNEEGPLVNCDGCKGSGLMLAWNPKSSAVREKNVRCPKCKEKHDPSDACAKIEQEQLPLWDKQAGFEWINEFQATSVFHNCSRCLGTGKATWCYTCGGAGDYVMRTDLDHDPRTVPCYNCNGTGQDDRLCEKCKGSGLTRTAANESDRTCNICGQQMEEDDDVCPFCLNGATDEAIEREAAKHAGWKSCYWCDGSGTSPDCAGCSGTGERWNDWEQSILACPFCKGSGDNPADSMRCQLCNGSGLEKETSKQALFDYDPVRDVNPSSTRSAPAPSPQGQSRDPWRDPRNKLAPPRQSGGQKRALLDYDPVRDVSPGSNKSAPAPSATKPVGDPWHDEADNGIDQQRPGFIFDPKLKKWVKDLQGTYPEIGPTFPGVTDINKVGAHYWGYDKCNVCNGEGCAECKGSGLQGRECPGCGGTGEVFKCPECSWANAALDEEDRECPNCGVERELVPCDEDDEDAKFQRNAKTEMEQCDHCDGSGTRSGERCEFCSGSGIVPSIDDMSQIAEFKCRECGTHYNDEGHDWEYGDLYCPGCGGHYEIDGIRQMPKQSHKQEGYAQCWQCGFGAAGCNECRGTGLVPDRPIHHALNHLKDEGYNVRDMSGSYGRMFTITPYDQRKGEDHTPGLQFGHSDDDGWYARFYSDDPGGDPEREEYRDAIREGYPHLGQCDQDPDFAGPDQWQGNDHDEMHYKKFDPHDMVGFVHKMHDKYKDELGAIKKQGSIVVGAAYNWIRWNEDRAGGTYLVTAAACPWHMREASTREGFDKIRTHGVKLCHFCGKSDPVNEVKIAEKQTAIQPCFQCDGTGLDPHTIDNSMCTLCKGSGIINLLEKGFLERAPEKVREELLNKFASGSMGSVSGYVYDSDVHCEDCAYERFGDKLDTDEAEDSSGEPPSPIMSYDDWETPSTCGTCGKPFCTVCGSNGGSFKDKEDCERCEGAGKTEEVKAKPPRWELCHGCDGAGNKNCYCKGSGIVHMPEQEHVPSQPCPDCKGQGTFDNVYECGNCGTKSGYIENEGFQYLSKKAQVERDLCVRCEGEGCQACQQSGIRAVPMDLRPLHRHLLLQHGDVDDLGQLDMMNDEQLEFTHKDWHRDEEEFLDGEPNDHPYEKIGQAFPQQPGDHQADNGIEDPVKDTKKTWLKKIVPDTTETLPGNNEMNVSIDNMPKTGEKTKGLPEGRCHGVRDQSLRCWTPALPGGMYCEMHQADMDERKREMDDHFDNHREAYFPGCDRCDGDRELDVALGRPIKPEHQASKTGQAHDPQPDAEDDQEAQQQQPSDLAMHVVQSHPQMAEELDLIDALDQFTDMELDELHIEDHMAGANDHLPETLRVAKVAMMYETGYCPECKTIEPTTVDGKCDTCGTELPDAWDTDHFDGKTR